MLTHGPLGRVHLLHAFATWLNIYDLASAARRLTEPAFLPLTSSENRRILRLDTACEDMLTRSQPLSDAKEFLPGIGKGAGSSLLRRETGPLFPHRRLPFRFTRSASGDWLDRLHV